MKSNTHVTGMAIMSLLLAAAPLLAGCGGFWNATSTATTTTLAASATTAVVGASVTLTATVSPSAATGTVTFYDGSTSLGSTTLSSGTASLSTSFSATGTHSITATYAGSTTYAASSSSTISVTCTSSSLTATTTTLTSTSYSATAGTAFTLTSTVAVSSTGNTATAATGTVEFYDATTSTNLGAATLSSGTATLTTSLSVAEIHQIEAIYIGDSTYATSTSTAIAVLITATSSSSTATIALSVSPSTATYGSGVALAAIVTPVTSTGTVTFYDNSTQIGVASLVSGSAVAALTTTSLAVGSHAITARYSSLTSSSATVTVTTATAGNFTAGASCGKGAGLNVLTTGTLSTSSQTYTTSTADQNAICVTGTNAYLTLISPAISTSSVTSNNDNSSFYGLDAAVLDYNGGNLTIDGGSIATSGAGGNLVFSYGTGTVSISNATLSSTSPNNGHGIYAAGAGTVVANNVTATTTGSASSIVATDSGGGAITINGGTYTVSGAKSAGIYSTGAITAHNATFNAEQGEGVVIEGSNIARLYNSILNISSTGAHRGIFLYQSMSGDAANNDCGTKGDCFEMTGGAINYKDTTSSASADYNNCSVFAVTNQTSFVQLTDVTITNSCPTLILADINQNWTGFSGGKLNFYAYGETLTGNVIVDATSYANLYLYASSSSGNASTLTGVINSANPTRDSSTYPVTLTMDKASTWIVTGASHLTALTDADSTYSNIKCATAGCLVYIGSSSISPATN